MGSYGRPTYAERLAELVYACGEGTFRTEPIGWTAFTDPRLADALGVHTSRCVMIGDTGGDVAAAQAAQAKAVLVPTERTRCTEISDARVNAKVAASLDEAVTLVLEGLD